MVKDLDQPHARSGRASPRWAITPAAAAIALVLFGWWWSESSPTPTTVGLSKLGISQVVLSYQDRVVAIDKSGATRTVPNPTTPGANNNGQLVLSGGQVVLTEGGRMSRVPWNFGGGPVMLRQLHAHLRMG